MGAAQVQCCSSGHSCGQFGLGERKPPTSATVPLDVTAEEEVFLRTYCVSNIRHSTRQVRPLHNGFQSCCSNVDIHIVRIGRFRFLMRRNTVTANQ